LHRAQPIRLTWNKKHPYANNRLPHAIMAGAFFMPPLLDGFRAAYDGFLASALPRCTHPTNVGTGWGLSMPPLLDGFRAAYGGFLATALPRCTHPTGGI
jgi:hypothetical protein